ncbi:hypothetical protein D3C87_2011400 [compost metagenome]
MGNSLPAGQGLGELRIHVVREEIARMSGMNDKVGLGDRPAGGQPDMAKFIVFEMDCLL